VCVHHVDRADRAAQVADRAGVGEPRVGRDLDGLEPGTALGEPEPLVGRRRPAHGHGGAAGDEPAGQGRDVLADPAGAGREDEGDGPVEGHGRPRFAAGGREARDTLSHVVRSLRWLKE
jgi:hypothetical protein